MNIFYKLWHSPTFTQYGKYFATLGSLLFVLPFVLSKYNEVDIAIWLLISTVTMFAMILSQRLSITFMRIISFAFAGATDFRPIKDNDEKRGDGNPNWKGLVDIFATLHKVFIYISFFTSTVVLVALFFGMNNLVDNVFNNEYILILFIVTGSTFITQNLIKYNIFLMGFNEVALVNRWNTLFGVFGIVLSITVINFGGEILYLILVQQLILVFSALRDKWLFDNYLLKKDIQNNGQFDKNIILAIKEPLWKGLVGHVSQMGLVQFSGIIFTIYGDISIVASYLFALRILTMLAEFSQVPFSSKQPYFSKLRSEGKIEILANVYKNRISISLFIYVLGVISVMLLNSHILSFIDSKVEFVSNGIWLPMGFLYGIERANIFYLAILASANQIVLYKEQIISAIVSLGFIFLSIQFYGLLGLLGLILAIWIPRLLIFNVKPLFLAASSLNQKSDDFGIRTSWPLSLIAITSIKGI